eukprot:4366088-Amphidinium_carterae.1
MYLTALVSNAEATKKWKARHIMELPPKPNSNMKRHIRTNASNFKRTSIVAKIAGGFVQVVQGCINSHRERAVS